MLNAGFIGLGIMGLPMAVNLLKAGVDLTVYNRTAAKAQKPELQRAVVAESIADVARRCNIIITMLPDSPEVREVALGKNGILEHAGRDTLVIDMSSIAPASSVEIDQALSKHGMHLMDAPVSGGEIGAVNGTLTIMAGGRAEDFARAKPYFEILGSCATHIGPIGSGNMCKLANQVIVAANLAALSEALILVKKGGADPDKVFQAIRGGMAGSFVMEAKTPMMLRHSFQPGFKIDLHEKDLRNAINAADLIDAPLPLTALIVEMLRSLQDGGFGQEDHSAVIRYYEQLAGRISAG